MFPAIPRTAHLLPLALLAALLLACTREVSTPVATVSPTATVTAPTTTQNHQLPAVPSPAPTPRPDEAVLTIEPGAPTPAVLPPGGPTLPDTIPVLRPNDLPRTVEALSAFRGDVVGWFSEPRDPSGSETRNIAAPPRSPVTAPPTGPDQVLLFDTRTSTVRDLGIGWSPSFSPGGSLLAWTTEPTPGRGGQLVVFNAANGQERRLGEARSVRWVDANTIAVYVGRNDRAYYDVRSGGRGPGWPSEPPARVAVIERAGYRLETRLDGDWYRIPGYPFFYRTARVTRMADGASFTFEAYQALLTEQGEVVIATMPLPDPAFPRKGGYIGEFTSNIFTVDFQTRQAAFVGTARLDDPDLPLAATATHIVWSDRACSTRPTIWMYDRRSRTTIEVVGDIEPSFRFTPSGALAVGSFGAKALIDPDTLTYLVQVPFGRRDVAWSSDYRFAAVGGQLGHGGLCLSYVGP